MINNVTIQVKLRKLTNELDRVNDLFELVYIYSDVEKHAT